MATKLMGTRQDRYERLDRIGRRCDGNNRSCLNNAVDEYVIRLADGFGKPLLDTEPEIRRSCGRHRAQFLASGRLVVLSRKQLT